MTFEEARAQFPVLERRAYLNAGTNGPLARSTVAAFEDGLERDLADGRSGLPYVERMLALRTEARRALADVLRVDAANVALVDSTTRGCATVLAGLGLGGEDEVVTTDHEHFGLMGPLFATGARVVIVDADEDAMLAAIGPRTRLLATSHVLWTTGRRLDVHRLKRESGLPLLIDGAQSAGAIPVDVGDVDFYTVSAQKWLCAPDPAGGLYVRDAELVRVKTPSYFSQDAYEASGAFTPKEGAPRFDSGWIGLPQLQAIVAAAEKPVTITVSCGDGGALPRAARAARRDRDAARPLDARVVPAERRSGRARRRAARTGRDRPGSAGPQPRPRVVRLVDERGRPAAPGGRRR